MLLVGLALAGGAAPESAAALRSQAIQPAAAGRQHPVYLPAIAKPSPLADLAAWAVAQRAAGRLNHYRRLAGLPAVATHPLLTRAAHNHAQYYVQNSGDPSLAGLELHREKPGRPGFTGVEPTDRAAAAGYAVGQDVTVDENIGLLGDPERVIDAFVDTVNHRWNMIHPSLKEIGYAATRQPPADVLDLGFLWGPTSLGQPGRYPGPGQSGVPTSSSVAEAPDPAPGAPRPLGYPITIAFPLPSRVTFGAVELRMATGERVESYVGQKAWLRALAIIPKRPLRDGTQYIVVVNATRDGAPLRETWSFTTR